MLPILQKSILPAYSVLAALLFGVTPSAKAQYTTDQSITFTGTGKSEAVTLSYKFTDANKNVIIRSGEATTAGNYNFSVNGTSFVGFCTDLADNISPNETWTAANGLTFNLLPTTPYASAAMHTAAVDYIVQNYTNLPDQSAAAQLAIWDLVVGGNVTNNTGGYAWDTDKFQVTDGFANATNVSEQAHLKAVYNIEQQALLHTVSSGSMFWKPVTWSGGRPQDIATASGVPEPGAVALLSSLGITGTFFAVWRRRRRPLK
jgi:hypothetical protein